jgi:hypothetical protein
MKLNTKELLRDKNVLRVMVFFAVVTLLGYVMIKDVNAVVFFIIVGFLSTYYSKNMIIVAGIAILATNIMVLFKRNTYYEGFLEKGIAENASKIIAGKAIAFQKLPTSDKAVKKSALIIEATKSVKNIPGYVDSVENNKLVDVAVTSAFAMAVATPPPTETVIAERIMPPLIEVAAVVEGYEDDDADLDEVAAEIEDELEGFDTESSKKNLSGASLDENDADKLVKRQKDLLAQYEKLQPSLERSYKLLNSMGGADGVQGMIEKVGGMIDKFGGLAGKIK